MCILQLQKDLFSYTQFIKCLPFHNVGFFGSTFYNGQLLEFLQRSELSIFNIDLQIPYLLSNSYQEPITYIIIVAFTHMQQPPPSGSCMQPGFYNLTFRRKHIMSMQGKWRSISENEALTPIKIYYEVNHHRKRCSRVEST